ncbi:MAG: hypothetical protein U1E73_12435 [Planctomycetota bacterium]
MYAARLLPPVLFAAALAAQTVDPPTLPQLGPLPQGARTLVLGADGAVWLGDKKLEGDAIAAAIPAKALFVLAADRAAKCGDVEKILAAARKRGATKAVFAARLPDGKVGALTLALPAADEPAITVELRLHHERTGVPPGSVIPVLARMVRGAETMVNPFVVGVAVPADEEFEPVLQVLEATAEARAQGAVLRTVAAGERPAGVGDGLGLLAGQLGGKAAPEGAGKGLAIDLGTAPLVRVSARDDATAMVMHKEPYGLLSAPERREAGERGGGAGGRYGGRGGRAARPGRAQRRSTRSRTASVGCRPSSAPRAASAAPTAGPMSRRRRSRSCACSATASPTRAATICCARASAACSISSAPTAASSNPASAACGARRCAPTRWRSRTGSCSSTRCVAASSTRSRGSTPSASPTAASPRATRAASPTARARRSA